MAEKDPQSLLLVADEPASFLRPREDRLHGLPFAVCSDPRDIPGMLKTVDPTAVFVMPGPGIPKSSVRPVVEHPSVRWVANAGMGVEHLGRWAADRVTVTNAGGVLSEFLAEYTLSAVQMANVGFPDLIAQQRRREWRQHPWTPLAGKTISVIGLGHVGRAVARRAKVLGMRVIGMRARDIPTPEVDLLLPEERLCNAMARADFVSVHVPETPKTVGLVGKSAFACMGRGTVLLNLSRGPVVDQEALLQALDNGKVGCAVLDVFDEEPLPGDHPFWSHEKVVVSPHMADLVPDWRARMFDAFVDNLDRFIAGSPLSNVVDPDRGY